ncbi:2-oxo-4-hydroxy-4-carboxy-5-ureidoimidazoline decarboxylase [Streptomyces beihaiensis]|uniref:2-oxo-4-hydroxy-4-carboxy-5-ureidoimidazoline decarboxylase n=1 Tax=Streptomyces beihaiensis TaxID=2984495 RepID=A0ABT3TPP1_9ACTN|nr:2-oxo-4-hydroxy-4-carboxy-5-ureidoimidazoline decarboxylase [Streptomyces beihaiensis]MCX3059002.1 2-oxo-4-hydroxy-4-carboxy-5-ureidoimidazoline decarboxylase [Streptomyces beihaiensis]
MPEAPLPAHRPSHAPVRLPIPAQPAPHGGHGGVGRLNALPRAAAEQALFGCCGSHAWARRLAAHRPYPDLDALLAAADEAAYDLSPEDIGEALDREELPLPPDAAAYSAAYTALAAAHGAYESKFRHPFVICLDGVAPSEALDHLLAALYERMDNDPEDERVRAADELRRLARARLTRLVRNVPVPREAVTNSPYVPV